jgi:hypothetical protein
LASRQQSERKMRSGQPPMAALQLIYCTVAGRSESLLSTASAQPS